jgi:hypothetical protein
LGSNVGTCFWRKASQASFPKRPCLVRFCDETCRWRDVAGMERSEIRERSRPPVGCSRVARSLSSGGSNGLQHRRSSAPAAPNLVIACQLIAARRPLPLRDCRRA